MKFCKKTVVFVLCILLLAISLASCKQDNGAANTPQGNIIIPPKPNLIFSETVFPNIICNDTDEVDDEIGELAMSIFNTTYRTPSVYNDSQPKAAHEIVIGKSNREISETAYRYLERIERKEGEVAYIIYSNGSSVAVAYDEDRYGIKAALCLALGEFDELFDGSSEIIIPKGVIAHDSFDPLEYQEALDEKKQAYRWSEFELEIERLGGDGKAIAAAVKEYYDLVCTDNVISWFANLYDPAVGGYYFSNDARNTPGFLPDIESTQQALGQINASGMLNDVDFSDVTSDGDRSYIKALPEWFRTQVIRFMKSRQDPETGFFYHPQWSKSEVDKHLSRRARDLNRAVGILQMFGSNPTYDTPNGDKGDGITWDEYDPKAPAKNLTGRLIYGSTSTLAVSKVVPTAETAIPSHMTSVSTFKAYLAEQLALNQAGKRSFYSIGNEIGSQISQIQTRDKQLDPSGRTQPLGDVLIAWYTQHQNKETGLWDPGLTYDNTNAILKIGGTYTDFGYVFPNADKAFESCVALLMTDEIPHAIVEVYNVWYAISNLMINVNECSTTQAEKDYATEVRLKLLEMAPEAIRLSAAKQLAFKHPDGSLGYTVGSNCVTSQGMRVAPPGDGEGDVNATTIGMSGTINNCLKALGLYGKQPGYFTKADLLEYVAILEDLGPVIKNDTAVKVDYDDFDGQEIGTTPVDIKMSSKVNGSITVVERYGADSTNRAMEFVTNNGDYETVELGSQSGALNANCFVFESDIMIKSASDNTTVCQILMQPAVYMIAIQSNGGELKLVESSSNSWRTSREQELVSGIKLGEWFNLKFEYYVGDHNTVRIKVYYNNELIAITDNYYDASGVKLTGEGTPVKTMDYVNIVGLTSVDLVMQLDNVAVYKTSDEYKKLPASKPQPPINIDPPDREQIIYDFDDEIIPDDFHIISGDAVPDMGALRVSGDAESQSNISLPVNLRFGSAKCAILDTDITVGRGAEGTVSRFYFTEKEDNSTPLACFELAVVEINGEKHTVLLESPDGKPGAQIVGTAVALGQQFNLRMEYYEAEKATLIYINGKLVGLSGATCKNAEKYSVRTLVMTSAATSSFEVYYDNFIFEKDTLSFQGATSSEEYPRKEYDFNNVPDDIVLSDGATVNGGFLRFGSVGSCVTIPLTDRNIVTSAAVMSLKASNDELSGSYVFTFVDSLGKEIISFELVSNGETINIYEYYAGGRGTRLSTVNFKSGDFTVEFKYYFKESIMNIFVNGEAAGATSLTHTYDRDSLTPAAVVIKQISGISKFNIDNCYAERTIDLYTKITVPAGDTPEIEKIQTFESSSFESYPKAVTSSLGMGSRIAIKAMMTETGISKMLAFTTATGNNDSVTFTLQDTNKISGANVLVYEADMIFDMPDGAPNAGVEIYFRKGSTYDARYLLYFDPENNGNRFGDWWSGEGSGDKKLPVNENQRFNIRIEYTVFDNIVTTNVFINGTYLGTCTRTKDVDIALNDIDRVVFYSQGAFNGNIYFDNVNFYQAKETTPIN